MIRLPARRTRRARSAVLALVLLGAWAVEAGGAGAAIPKRGVRLERVARVDTPTAMAVRPGDEALYVAEQGGRVVAVRDGATAVVLDLGSRIRSGGEQGLLGLTFSADGSLLYVHYSGTEGQTVLDEYAFVDGRADRSTRRMLLEVAQPQSNHNGGALLLGPDGMLWLGLGDGGGGGDEGPGHAGGGNGQSLDTLLGKLLRIDPRPSAGRPYSIPPDNPFASGGGRPEIWAYGLRNPWKFSFDRATGDLWLADVGQNAWEEIDHAPAPRRGRGANYGWNVFEGTHRFRPGTARDAVEPLVEISHSGGDCSVTGGYVYRGSAIPKLKGTYVFSDYCNGRLRGVRQRDGEVTEQADLGIQASRIAAFGEDGAGELYVLSQSTGLHRLVAR